MLTKLIKNKNLFKFLFKIVDKFNQDLKKETPKMKKFFLITALLLIGTTTIWAQKYTTITRFENHNIRGLIVDGVFDVRISQGKQTKVSVEILDEMADKLYFDYTDDDYVRVTYKNDVTKHFTSNRKKPMLTVVVSELNSLRIGGACSLIAKGEFTASSKFRMEVTGAAFASFINIKCPEALIELLGASNAEDIKIVSSGTITISGNDAAKGKLNIKCKTLNANTSGASRVSVIGNCSAARTESSGTSILDLLNLNCPEFRSSATGMSRTTANVSGTANITVSSMASFRYMGTGRIIGSGAKPL